MKKLLTNFFKAKIKVGRDWRTREIVSEEEYKKNPDRYHLIEVIAYTDPRLTRLRALIYEPEHYEGGTCWCLPKRESKGRRLHFTHYSQKDDIIDFVAKNFR